MSDLLATDGPPPVVMEDFGSVGVPAILPEPDRPSLSFEPSLATPGGVPPALPELEPPRVRPEPGGLLAEYFNEADLTEPAALRIRNVDLDAGTGQPLRDVAADTWSVRWSGTLTPRESGEHVFVTRTDDGVRLWIDDELVIGDWEDQPLTENRAAVALQQGEAVPIRMEVYNRFGEGEARLLWSTPSSLGSLTTVPAELLRPAEPTLADVIVNGMRILAQPIDSGTFLVSARPAVADEAQEPGRVRTELLRAPGDTTLAFDEASGRITLREGEEVLWTGSVGLLDEVGRASVPGSEIAWDETEGARIYGLGERFDTLNQAGRFVVNWIEDIPGQDLGRASYYTAPLVFSPDAGYGLFVTDDPEGYFSFGAVDDGVNWYRRAEEDVTFILAEGDTMEELIAKRTRAIGGFEGVPDWSYGPWISRNSYETQWEAMAAVQEHLDRDLPVAAIVLEAWKGTSETGNWNNFSPERFPDLDLYFDFMDAAGVRTILWQVPLIFPTSPGFEEAADRGYFVRGPDGEVRLRSLWLAGAANVDFTNPEAVAWWQDMMRDEVRRGVTAFKTDDGEDIEALDVFSDGRRGWEMHNEYATLYNQAVWDLLQEEDVDGLVWSRSGSLGRERSPALWAGDQEAEWSSIDSLITAGLSAGISGMPFWSHDIGGYLGDPEPELYIRWTQFGAWSPLMQYHGISPREPWLFGEEALDAYRLNVELRMNLVPHFVALGEEAQRTGLPLMRPMFMVFPDDPAFRDDTTQYMLGEDILVAPITNPGLAGRYVQFPEGRWISPVTNEVYEQGRHFVPIGLVDAPIFLREGAELAVQLLPEFDQLRPYAWEAGLPVRTITVGIDPARQAP